MNRAWSSVLARKVCLIPCVAATIISLAAPVMGSVVFTGSSLLLSAKATFTNDGSGNLKVLLENLGGDVLVPADVLTAVFFTVGGDPTLMPISAVLGTSTVVFGPQPFGGNVGGEWAYVDGLVGAPGGADEGISSSGFGLFGGFNFNGPNLDGQSAVNGMNYGLLSAADNNLTGNAAVTGASPFIQHSVLFTLNGLGLAAGVEPTITNVSFQYGTALDEPNISVSGVGGGGGGTGGGVPNVPEPTTLAIWGAFGLIGCFRKRCFRKRCRVAA